MILDDGQANEACRQPLLLLRLAASLTQSCCRPLFCRSVTSQPCRALPAAPVAALSAAIGPERASQHIPACRHAGAGLALACSSHSLLALCLAWLATRRRRFYARHREALLALACLHVICVSHALALLGGTNLFAHSRGSPLLLLFATLVCNGGLWVGFYMVFARLGLAWSRVALLLLALLPLLLTKRLCGRMLEAPGAKGPLLELYVAMEAVHSATIFPPSALPLPAWTADPQQQCAAVSAWSLLLSAVAVPLLVLRWLDTRRQQQAALQQRRREAAAAAAAGLAAEGSLSEMQVRVQEARRWRPAPWWLLELHLTSCLLWSLSILLHPLLPRW